MSNVKSIIIHRECSRDFINRRTSSVPTDRDRGTWSKTVNEALTRYEMLLANGMRAINGELSEQELAICCAAFSNRSQSNTEDVEFIALINTDIMDSIQKYQLNPSTMSNYHIDGGF